MLRIFKQYYPIRNIFFVIGEFLVIYISVVFAALIFSDSGSILNELSLFFKIFLIAFICQTCLYYNDLYDFKVTDSFSELSIRLLQALGATTIILAGIYSVFPETRIGLNIFIISIGFDLLFIVSWRIGYKLILNSHIFDEKIIIIGSGGLSRNIIKEIAERKDCGHIVTGVILEGHPDEDLKMRKLIENQNESQTEIYNHNNGNLSEIVKKSDVNKIIVSIEDRRRYFPTQHLLQCRVDGIEILEGSTFYEMLTGKLLVDDIKPGWLIFSDGFRKSPAKHFVKRTVDIVLSFIMLIMLFPLILFIAVLIKLDSKEPEISAPDTWRYFIRLCKDNKTDISRQLRELILSFIGAKPSELSIIDMWIQFRRLCSEEDIRAEDKLLKLMKIYIAEKEPDNPGRPVFFSQERMGMKGKIYNIYKFRSMIVNAEKISGPVWAGENDKRITRIGNFIRKWRIDELPQLWNVLKGEMSFVGPRPEREYFVKQLEETIPFYRERLSVKPGLTGWAQVSYGYGATEDDAKEKLNYDLFYIKNMSTAMDLMIVLRTVKIVIFGKGR